MKEHETRRSRGRVPGARSRVPESAAGQDQVLRTPKGTRQRLEVKVRREAGCRLSRDKAQDEAGCAIGTVSHVVTRKSEERSPTKTRREGGGKGGQAQPRHGTCGG